MKFNPIPLITALLLLSLPALSQSDDQYRLYLKNGSLIPEKNSTPEKISAINSKLAKTGGRSFLVIQFERIPSETEKKQLQQAGVELLDYVPNNAYTATVTGPLPADVLNRSKARAIVEMTPAQKMEPVLLSGNLPARAVKVAGTVDVWINFPRTFSFETVSNELSARNFDVTGTIWKDYRIISLRVSATRLQELASLAFVEYVQTAPKEDEFINNKTTVNARANVLQSPIGRNLRGQGIVIGIGDNADPMTHVDFTNRLIHRAANIGAFHGVNVIGIAAGAGIIEEKFTGFAPKATIVTQATSNILAYAPVYVQDYNMVITNNSYGNITDDCQTFGVYDLYSRIMDLQEFQMPNMQHVFAAGNSGGFSCSPYTPGFSNVLGGYQTAKNVITVANTDELGVIRPASSKGPVRDGRIKPEISAQGYLVWTTYPGNFYFTNSGTSMAAPGVAGGLALLYQRYRQLHANADPKNGLMKALLCNGASDKGNPGPDYTYGFGWMNLLRSVTMLENNNYFTASVTNAGTNSHSITIPGGSSIAQLKVMLYWNDSAAAVLANNALVNDLDLEVTDPASTIHLPQLLDTVPANVTNVATTGADHFNNIEQVVINNPSAGTYNFTVRGTTIPFAAQHEYFLVFDTLPVSSTLTYPIGGERLKDGDSIYISWDSYGSPANDFTLQYSTDNGGSWTNINTTVPAGSRQYKWFIPAVTSDQARVKLIRNSTGIESTSGVFTIVGVPTASLSAVQCEGYISIDWTAVPGSTDYEVMLLRGDEMVPVATTAATNYVIKGLSKDTLYWVSVRARLNGNPGRRATALSRQPNNGTCAATISDNDLKADALIAPVSGRVLTSSALTATNTVTVRVKNLDDAAINTFNVKYSVNGGAFVTEAGAGPINAGATYTHTFAATYDFSATGNYIVRAVVENASAADPVSINDTLTVLVKHLPNAPITLVTGSDFLDDIESADDSTYYSGQIGMSGADRYDFNSSTVYGRARTFVNTGIAYSGHNAITLDADRYNAAGTADSLKATFNLQPHAGSADDIRLDFVYKNHGQGPDNANKVWIRGDDQQPWIEVYDLYANQEDSGVYKRTSSIQVSDLLAANTQDFSSSFQLRFGQYGHIITADHTSGAGYTFDDIHLYKVDNDLAMVSLDTPVVASCGLNNAVPVRVTVRNNADTTVNAVPVRFTVDGGAVNNGTIASVAGNTNTVFTFTGTADLSATGVHVIRVWVDYTGDSFRDNDTLTVTIRNSPVVSSFPYLEDFEAGDGSWFTEGNNNTWEYGTPASTQINRAASGSKAWKTRLAGNYNDQQLSYLYSPCFDITGMTNPTLSLSIALDLEDCGTGPNDLCDGAYAEYSADGITWTRLGNYGQGTNWYNRNYTANPVWSVQDYTHWHVATISLPAGLSRLRLRFVMRSDPFTTREGIAVDDIHIYDNIYGIYEGAPYTSNTINQPAVNGTGWIDFTDGGKLVASVNPNGQNMGSTNARVYINTGAVRISNAQFYHDRNITIKPANRNLADSATVRFYFLDTETETLINAPGCAPCSKPATAYELGVSKYTNADTSRENGTVADDTWPGWLFVVPSSVRKVPFDKGYYAEFKVKDFSEFWLNNGGIGSNQSLPAELVSFTARKKANKDVLLEWKTASEINTDRFEIELAKGNEEFQRNHFVKVGEVSSNGNSTSEQQYNFTDMENNKSGVRYYRLKIVDRDGRHAYSAVRPVVFDDEVKWQVYPNPSTEVFNFVYQAGGDELVAVKLYDINGKLVQQTSLAGNGFVQKYSIRLPSPQYTAGLYLLEVNAGTRKYVFRLIRQ